MGDTVQRWSDEDAGKRQGNVFAWVGSSHAMHDTQKCLDMLWYEWYLYLILTYIFLCEIDLVAILQPLGKILIFESYVKQWLSQVMMLLPHGSSGPFDQVQKF